MRTSSMWLVLFPISFILFTIPTVISSSSCPSKLPCNSTIEIRPPFFVDSPGLDPACWKLINVSCSEFVPELNLLTGSKLLLKEISYTNSTVTVQDVVLSVLQKLPCSLTLSFIPPVFSFESNYRNLETWFSSINCSDHNLPLFRSMFGEDKDVYPSVEPDERAPARCGGAPPLFQWILHFGELGSSGQVHKVNFSVLSAGIKKDLLSSTDCGSSSTGDRDHGNKSDIGLLMAMAVSTSVASGLLVACFFVVLKQFWKNPFYLQRNNWETKQNIELILSRYGIRPKRYKYSELKMVTRSFSEKLGRGGYGMVFKGALRDGRMVAVKLLHNSRGNDEEFVNEVVSIVNTSHINIVCLLGFCLEGSRRGLVYDYMPNGSLERYIYSENPKSALGWEQLYEVAIGIARGLEYLHKGCNRRIIHFDIKPHNILLDENYCPKIADFGLTKLCNPKESIVSMAGARGTIGFIALEVFSRSFGVVSTKSDIYSFGVMLLEMVGGRRNVQTNTENSSRAYLPQWLHDHLSQGGTLENFEVTSTTEEIARKMAIVGLQCIQMIPEARPSITEVIEMLERSVNELEIPPMQFYPCPSEPSIHSITTFVEEDVSLHSHVSS